MSDTPNEPRHAIGAVESRTGLSTHAIRAWENRYGAVEPERTEGGHRLYSEAQVRRLQLLRELTEHGHRIGRIATLPTGELEDLLRATREDAAAARGEGAGPPDVAEDRLADLMDAVRALDADRLQSLLRRAALERSAHALIEDVISPLLRRVGEAWHRGEVSPAQEHLASTVASRTLAWILDASDPDPEAPLAVVATPSGQLHDLGALLAAATTAARGWRISYLGGDLPGEEIAVAARTTGARAVVLSIVYPDDDLQVVEELRALRAGLPDGTAVLVGGLGSSGYSDVLEEIGGRRLEGYGELREELDTLGAA